MLSRPGPEEINQRKIMMYMTSGKYRKSSSQSINEGAFVMVATANELHGRNEIRHDVRKRDSGTDDRFVHQLVLTGDEKLVPSGDSEEYPKRDPGEENREFFQ
jgi:hypothetical protein